MTSAGEKRPSIAATDKGLRVALVGLSSPIAYQYDAGKFGPFGADYNAILPNPTALITLFDEIWFAHKALCPIDMRELDYVRFLHEDPQAQSSIGKAQADLQSRMNLFRDIHSNDEKRTARFPQLVETSHLVGYGARRALDNHSRSFVLGGNGVAGDSVSAIRFCFDTLLEDHLRDEGYGNLQLVTHPSSEQFFPRFELPETLELQVTHELIMRRIPNWQTDFGPYHPVHEELRTGRKLNEYRAMIRAEGTNCAGADALAMEIEKQYLKASLYESRSSPPTYCDAFRRASVVLIAAGGWSGDIEPTLASLLFGLVELPELGRLIQGRAMRNAREAVSFLGDVSVIGESPLVKENWTVSPNGINTLTRAETMTRLQLSKEKISDWASECHGVVFWGTDSVDKTWKLFSLRNDVILEFRSDGDVVKFADEL